MEKHGDGPFGFPKTVRGMDFFSTDRLLQGFLRQSAPGLLQRRQAALANFGHFCGTELDEQAEYSDRIHPPVWKAMPEDLARPGVRRGKVYFNRRYEDCHQEVYRHGFINHAFDADNPEPHLYAFVAQYLISQADISIGCPFAMTHPVAMVVARYAPEAVKARFLHESTRADGQTKTGGTWATEKHSGSDVGGTETVASYQKDGTVRLQGQKWFASNADSGLVVATARPEGAPKGGKGLGLYLVPSHVDADWRKQNDYEITSLKEKLGTRALATGEIDLNGALAYEIAPPPDGLRVMMEALGCSRVHNAMAAAGVMRRALNEALSWASNRETFSQKLITRPMVQKRIIELAVEWMAGSAMAFEAAHCFDEATKGADAYIWSRIVTALAKYKTAEQAVWCAQKALSLVAGNGYTEDYPTARQFRDAMVLPVWEGPEQIQALELMRMIAGKEPGDRVFFDHLTQIITELDTAGMQAEKDRLAHLAEALAQSFMELRANPAQIEQVADVFLHNMADILSYALLCRDAAREQKGDAGQIRLLVCGHYHDNLWNRAATPSLTPSPLLVRFGTLMHEVYQLD